MIKIVGGYYLDVVNHNYVIGKGVKADDGKISIVTPWYFANLNTALDGVYRRMRMDAVEKIQDGNVDDLIDAVKTADQKMRTILRKIDEIDIREELNAQKTEPKKASAKKSRSTKKKDDTLEVTEATESKEESK